MVSLDPASLSICEEISCQASDALVDGFDPVDDWPCAASSVLRVAGDSCEPTLSGAELVEAEAGLATSNGSTALKPEDFAEVRELLRLRPMQFCGFLKSLVGAEEIQRMMVEAIKMARQV